MRLLNTNGSLEKKFQRFNMVTEKILRFGKFPEFSGIYLPHVYYLDIMVLLF